MSFNVIVPIQLIQDISKHNMVVSGHSQLMDISVSNIDVSGNLIVQNVDIYQNIIDLSNNKTLNILIDKEITGNLSVIKSVTINENLDVSNILYVNNLDIYQKVNDLSIDYSLSASSNNAVSNSVITNALLNKEDIIDSTSDISVNNLDVYGNLIFQNTNIYQKVIDLSNITIDDTLNISSNNAVSNKAITNALLNKQDIITSTSDITVNNLNISGNLNIQNLDIYQKIIDLSNTTIDDNLDILSNNAVSNSAITNALLNKQDILSSTTDISFNNIDINGELNINDLNIYDKIIDLSNNGIIVATIDSDLNGSSNNLLTNSAITNALSNKQDIINSTSDISVNNLNISGNLSIQNVDLTQIASDADLTELQEKIEQNNFFMDNIFNNGTEISGNLTTNNDLIVNNLNIYQRVIELSNDEIISRNFSFNNLDISDILYVNNLDIYDKIIEISNNIGSSNILTNSVITTELSTKQDIITSTSDISVNNLDISGNLIVQNLNIYDKIIDLSNNGSIGAVIDSTLNISSTNLLSNSVITSELSNKQGVIDSTSDISVNNLDISGNLIVQNLNIYDKIIELSNQAVIIDNILNNSSSNTISNSVITNELSNKQDVISSTTDISVNNLNITSELIINNLDIYQKIADLCNNVIITIDSEMNASSINPVKSSVIHDALSNKHGKKDFIEFNNLTVKNDISCLYVDLSHLFINIDGNYQDLDDMVYNFSNIVNTISGQSIEISNNLYISNNNFTLSNPIKDKIFYAYSTSVKTLDRFLNDVRDTDVFTFDKVSLDNNTYYDYDDSNKNRITIKTSGTYKVEYNIHFHNKESFNNSSEITTYIGYPHTNNSQFVEYANGGGRSTSFIQKYTDNNKKHNWSTNRSSCINYFNVDDIIQIIFSMDKHGTNYDSFDEKFEQSIGSNIIITYMHS